VGKLVVGQSKTIRHAFLSELWILGMPRQEVLEGLSQLDDGHLWRVLAAFEHPREMLAFHGVELTAQRAPRGLG